MKYHWLQIDGEKVRYLESRKDITRDNIDQNFDDYSGRKVIELKEIDKVYFTIFRGSIVVKAKDGKTIHINLLTKPSALKNEVFELLSRYL